MSALTTSVELFKNLNTDLKKDRQTKEDMMRKINVLTGEILRTRKKLAESDRAVLVHQTDADALRKEKEAVERKHASVQVKHTVLEEALEKTRAKLRTHGDDLAKKERELFDAQDEISRLTAVETEMKSTLEITQKHLASGDAQLHKYESENSKLKAHVAQLIRERNEQKALQQKKSEQPQPVRFTKEQVQVVVGREANKLAQALVNLHQNVETEFTNRDKRIDKAMGKVKQLARWTHRCGAHLKKRVEIEMDLKRKLQKMEASNLKMSKLAEETQASKATIKNQIRKIRDLGKQKQELLRRVGDLKDLHNGSEARFGELRSDFEGQFRKFKNQCEQFRIDMENSRDFNERIKSELEAEKAENRRLKERAERACPGAPAEVDMRHSLFENFTGTPSQSQRAVQRRDSGKLGISALAETNSNRRTVAGGGEARLPSEATQKNYQSLAREFLPVLGDLIHKMESMRGEETPLGQNNRNLQGSSYTT